MRDPMEPAGIALNMKSNELITEHRSDTRKLYTSPLVHATNKVMKDHWWSCTMVMVTNAKWYEVIINEDNAKYLCYEFFDSFQDQIILLNRDVIKELLEIPRKEITIMLDVPRIYETFKNSFDRDELDELGEKNEYIIKYIS